MKTINIFFISLLFCFVIISCKTKDVIPEVVCSPISIGYDNAATKYAYDAAGKIVSGEVDGIPVKFEYTGSNITKMTYSNATANRVVTIEYDTQNRPVKAKKVYASTGFNFTQDYIETYDANGRLSTSRVDIKGDFEILMLHRLEYDAKGNVLKHFVKENATPEFLWAENSGFDDKKNVTRGVKLNPINLFYEPLNLFDSQSENNQTIVKTRVKNSEYLGGIYNVDLKYVYDSYNANGYPMTGTQDYTYEYDDYDKPSKTLVSKGSAKIKLDYLCK